MKLIILETNEIPHSVFDDYMGKNPKSILTKILKKSSVFTSISTDEEELHPWSTWPTLHRGVDNSVHGIKDIGENLNLINSDYPPIWDILNKNKITTGIFSSLHTYPLPSNVSEYQFFMPDPFANGSETHPEYLKPFQEFNLKMTSKSGRSVDRGIDKKSAIKLAFRLPLLGIRPKTIKKVLNQLIQEKRNPWILSRRRSFQSILAFDLYLKLLKKHKPSFTTFFTNHVASALHRYWAASYPGDYQDFDIDEVWINRYNGEIPFAMDQLNEMAKSLHSFVKKNVDYKLVIASSMGQAATKAKLVETELFLTDFDAFSSYFKEFNLEKAAAMHPQYNFRTTNPELFENSLDQFQINGSPISYRRKEGGFFSIDLGYPNVSEFAIIHEESTIQLKDVGFQIRKIDDQSAGTAYHIPEGSLFVYDPKNEKENAPNIKVDLREVAPSILKNYNIERPKYMREGIISAIFE